MMCAEGAKVVVVVGLLGNSGRAFVLANGRESMFIWKNC